MTRLFTLFARVESPRKSLLVALPESPVIVLVVPTSDASSHGEKKLVPILMYLLYVVSEACVPDVKDPIVCSVSLA